MSNTPKPANAVAIIALVLGILTFLISFIPFVNVGVIPMVVVTVICGVSALLWSIFGKCSGIIMSIAALVFALGGYCIAGSFFTTMDEALNGDQTAVVVVVEDLESESEETVETEETTEAEETVETKVEDTETEAEKEDAKAPAAKK